MRRLQERDEKYATTVEIIRQIALTGCRRSEMIGLMWIEADTDGSCLRLVDSKEAPRFVLSAYPLSSSSKRVGR
jgi:integrase